MNNLTPYEKHLKEQLSDLPVPSADKGWEQMEQLLNKKDKDRKPIIPFFSTAGCIGSMLLLGALVALLWIDPLSWRANNDVSKQPPVAQTATKKTEPASKTDNLSTGTGTQQAENWPENTIASGQQMQPAEVVSSNNRTAPQVPVQNAHSGAQGTKASPQSITNTGNRSTASINTTKRGNARPNKQGIPPAAIQTEREGDTDALRRKEKVANGKTDIAITNVPAEQNDVSDITTDKIAQEDSTHETALSKLQPDDTTKSISKVVPPIKEKEDSSGNDEKYKEKKHLHLAAGLTVYKGIPVGGAIDAAVNQAGRQNALSDYIPSVYLRLYKEQTWFVQAEFRYGVPQYTNAFMYKQNRQQDADQNVTTTSYKLRKTYYHQLPVSFNYFVMPGWSVGTGLIYNRFKGAVSSESVLQSNARMVNDSLVSFGVVSDRNDTSFVKHTFQWLVETQYKYGRFSLGARYAQGLQPFIKYRDPSSGAQISRKNNSVYVFLRYELWRQRRN